MQIQQGAGVKARHPLLLVRDAVSKMKNPTQ
jgi:hypothetical protein